MKRIQSSMIVNVTRVIFEGDMSMKNVSISSIENSTGLVLYPKIAQKLGLCLVENKVKPGLLAEGTTGQIAHEISSLLQENGIRSFEARELANNSLSCSTEKIIANELVKELSDTVALFSRLKQHGSKIAVCTADNRKSSLLALKRMGVTHLVDMIVCGDDKNTIPKPNPHNALKICSFLNIKPSQAIMVGDTRVDIEMAHNAQLGAAVGVLSGIGCRDHLHKADVLLDHVGHLVETFYEK
uniref:Phosphoglycolate phosphatase n=1 Tax=Caenorhabditis japonica TaxID=281687 RepID=A0A8R1I934_CAEJA